MIVNLTKQSCVARVPLFADRFFLRLRGMMMRRFRCCGFDAMVFENCNAVHTFFMLEKIDIVFVDRSNKICLINSCADCWKPILRSSEAVCVLELPAGRAGKSRCECGDYLDLRMVCSEDAEAKIAGSRLHEEQLVTQIRFDR